MTQISWTYNTLASALQIWMDDTDVDWVANFTPPAGSVGTTILALDYIIQLAELRVVTDLDLTIFDQSNTLALPAGTGTNNQVARPVGLIVADELFYATVSGPSTGKLNIIERRDWGFIQDYLDTAITGPPLYYAEQDVSKFIFAPFADQSYTVTAFGVYAAQSLTDIKATGTTWISANVGDLLHSSALMEAAQFLKNEGKRKVQEMVYGQKLAADKVRLRALRRNVIEDPRAVGGQAAEGQLPASAPAQANMGNVLTRQ